MLDPGALDRQLKRLHAGERRLVGRDHLTPPLLESVQFAKLPEAERTLNVAHIVLEPGSQDLVPPLPSRLIASGGVTAEPLQAQHPPARYELRVPRQHPALARREVLRRVEAERHWIGARPNRTPPVGRRQSVRPGLEHNEAVGSRQLANRI